MIRVLAQWWAKKQYIFKQEVEAATAELHAGLSLKLATEKRTLIEQLNNEADDIDTNIKAVDEKLATGYFECENGHEKVGVLRQKLGGEERRCIECDAAVKYVSRELMTGQEKTQADRERNEAQTIAANKREQAKAEEDIYPAQPVQRTRHVPRIHQARAQYPRRAGRRQYVLRGGCGLPEGCDSGVGARHAPRRANEAARGQARAIACCGVLHQERYRVVSTKRMRTAIGAAIRVRRRVAQRLGGRARVLDSRAGQSGIGLAEDSLDRDLTA